METTVNKQELIDWINEQEDPATLNSLQMLKKSSEYDGDWWDEISETEKAGIRRGEKDIKAGRVHSSDEFWGKVRQKRKQKS